MKTNNDDLLEQFKSSIKDGTMLTKLIFVNLSVYIFILLSGVFFSAASDVTQLNPIVNWLAMPAKFTELYKFWGPVTYMFLHEDFMHIAFNMLILYMFGKVFLQFLSQKQLLSIYILGGLSGALIFILAFNIIPTLHPYRSMALGASASVMAVVIAIAVYKPKLKIKLLVLGPVQLQYIAMVVVALDIAPLIDSDTFADSESIIKSNIGGHIAHLGGALFGFFYIKELNKGKDMSRTFNRLITNIVSYLKSYLNPDRKIKMKVTHRKPKNNVRNMDDMEYNANKHELQEKIDIILDKISKSGYDSLTKEEKETLFKMSK